MNRNILKKYAPQARRDFIQALTARASYYGLTKKKTEPVTVEGDVAVITGRAFPKKVGEQRKQLDGDVAVQPRLTRLVNSAHPALTEQLDDLELRQTVRQLGGSRWVEAALPAVSG